MRLASVACFPELDTDLHVSVSSSDWFITLCLFEFDYDNVSTDKRTNDQPMISFGFATIATKDLRVIMKMLWWTVKLSLHLCSTSPVSNDMTLIPLFEEATIISSSQQHLTRPISSPASGTVSSNVPSLMSQTLTTPTCEPTINRTTTTIKLY